MNDVVNRFLSSNVITNEIYFGPIDRLYSKLTPKELAAIHSEAQARGWPFPPDSQKRFQIVEALRYGTHLFPEIAQKTGLKSAAPPQNIHNMSRMEIDCGNLYVMNLIEEMVQGAGRTLSGRGLDFGCSSGRVARNMPAVFPEVEWHGCDPEGDAVAWAKGMFPNVQFTQSPFNPPTDFNDAYFDFVYAISIWSHFSEKAALAWFDEMGRIIRPGGMLYWTTHGQGTLAQWAKDTTQQSRWYNISEELILKGYMFEDAYRKTGDWSADVSDWGLSYIMPQWVIDHLTPAWRILNYRPTYHEWNHDVYLLERK